ncbi:MAG: vitamin B12-dependent ribonucleotide reductase [Candidatus Hinthialibacter antarcticus]|nr:vitamin B12-dependent ribonucleotide reductase [Candidatus Hinthialibacter antarcticus]
MAIVDSNRLQAKTDAGMRDAKKEMPNTAAKTKLKFQRVYTKKGQDPFDQIEWEVRDAVISGEKGDVVFEQRGVEFPKFWSQLATNVVVSKYFRGTMDTPERETSVRQLIGRVVSTIVSWGQRQSYFESFEDQQTFGDELTYLLLHQHTAFNSPVWFNVGVEKEPQCSACFINSVDDTMTSILELAKTEGMLFKFGSGTGSNLSPIRSSKEKLRGGGEASGPVSFMKGYDAFAGVIKSGGKTRRAAKMVILNMDHPDIVDFIRSKAREEKKAWALIEAGYDGSFNGEAYGSIFFQNANHSVRVTDDFMHAVKNDANWSTKFVQDGADCETFKARDMMQMVSDCTYDCGDPGMQFDTVINKWHTCPADGAINASNPCSEYMFLDNTACNLASINLMKYVKEDGSFHVETFRHTVDIMISAQEMLVDNASYPTPKIDKMSHIFRTLGLGYANLGALLMANGLPYDSDEGRAYAAAITSLMCGESYAQSSRIAEAMEPFEAYSRNREPMLNVIGMHRDESYKIDADLAPTALHQAANHSWDVALDHGKQHGFRNAQVTVLAPTGTIAFMMDCDTTGIEPDIALVKYKSLVGGGMLKIVNNTVPRALKNLGYSRDQVLKIVGYVDEHDTIEGAPALIQDHLPVFDCAFKPGNGERSIQYMGHIRMMGAVQPFLSGAISKTVNLPEEATSHEIQKAYMAAWELGLKAVAVYRDGCKKVQPLKTRAKDAPKAAAPQASTGSNGSPKPYRRRLSDERQAITHKFSIAGHEGYITVGLFPDGKPGEIFLTMAKEGSVVSGLMDAFATTISLTLQYGVPLEVLVNKFSHTRFEPAGFTGNPEIPIAKSITDYIFRWMASKFLSAEEKLSLGIIDRSKKAVADDHSDLSEDNGLTPQANGNGSGGKGNFTFEVQADAPPCHECGAIMVRNGACYKCLNCGSTSGCS